MTSGRATWLMSSHVSSEETLWKCNQFFTVRQGMEFSAWLFCMGSPSVHNPAKLSQCIWPCADRYPWKQSSNVKTIRIIWFWFPSKEHKVSQRKYQLYIANRAFRKRDKAVWIPCLKCKHVLKLRLWWRLPISLGILTIKDDRVKFLCKNST